MTAGNPRTRTFRYRACAVGLMALCAIVGCKSGDGSKGTGGRDPLVYGPHRIPPQNVPVPSGGVGEGHEGDPLLERPVGKNGDKSGVSYNDDPARFKGPHIPGPASTPAALAGKTKNDGDELKIDTPDNRVPLQPVGGVVPVEGGSGVDALYRDLEKYGVRREDQSLTREDDKYLFRATITNANGTKRTYQGRGDTATDAVKQVLEQVTLDRK